MSAIQFTDADGAWNLHNGKPYPGSRAALWTPDSQPFGDVATALANGAQTRLRLRDDFTVSFELPLIPSRRSTNLVTTPEIFGGGGWVANGTPIRTPNALSSTGVGLELIEDNDAAAIEGFEQTVAGLSGNGTKAVSVHVQKSSAAGMRIVLHDTTAGVTRLRGLVELLSTGVPSLTPTAGVAYGYEYKGQGVYRVLFGATGVIAANSNFVGIGIAPNDLASDTGATYIGGVQVENGATPTPYLYNTTAARSNVSMVEIADRLRYHLLNGGTCSVYVNDIAENVYATCGLKPGTAPQLMLSDRRTMEYTLSLQLINLAGSPTRMLAHYAEQ